MPINLGYDGHVSHAGSAAHLFPSLQGKDAQEAHVRAHIMIVKALIALFQVAQADAIQNTIFDQGKCHYDRK